MLPPELRQIWRWFCEISETRHYRDKTALRIDRRELFYWAATRDVTIASWQTAALELLDDLYVKFANGERTDFSSFELTPQLFQSLFGK